MYKKVELLSKKEHKDLAIDLASSYEFTKDLGIVTIGISEIPKLSSILPIIISGGDIQQFAVISSVANMPSYFSKENISTDSYIPMMIQAYPFIMVDANEEGNKSKKLRAVAIDMDNKYTGIDKIFKIFNEDGSFNSKIKNKIDTVQRLEVDKKNSTSLINSLKKYNLLEKRSIEVKDEKNEKKVVVLKDFYVVNKKKLYEIDNDILTKWSKNGWLFMINSHIHSMDNLRLIFKQ